MESTEPTGYLAETLVMLRRARAVAQDALDRRRALGDRHENPPPAVAIRVLDGIIERISAGELEARGGGLGLSRGAGDLVWLPGEGPLLNLFYELDRWWSANGRGGDREQRPHSSLKIPHVPGSPRPGPRPPAGPN